MAGLEFLKPAALLKASAWTGVAAALALMAIPGDAFAQNRGDRGGGDRGSHASRSAPSNGGGWQGQRSTNGNGGGSWNRQPSGQQSQGNRIRMQAPEQRSAPNAGAQWRQGESRTVVQRRSQAAPVEIRRDRMQNGGQWQGQDRPRHDGAPTQQWQRRSRTDAGAANATGSGGQWQARRQADGQATPRSDWRQNRESTANDAGGQWQDRNRTYRNGDRNRTYRDNDRNRTYREGWRDGNRADTWRDRREQGQAYRQGWRDSNRNDRWRDNRRYSDSRRWDRDWRRDNRYDWHSYRRHNSHRYRIGRYYAPYNDYYYRRLSIGFYLDTLFYSSRYWIEDPYYYRLPPVYGPYRWVRYYDDALLVDVYTGEVVDVIYDFFW